MLLHALSARESWSFYAHVILFLQTCSVRNYSRLLSSSLFLTVDFKVLAKCHFFPILLGVSWLHEVEKRTAYLGFYFENTGWA